MGSGIAEGVTILADTRAGRTLSGDNKDVIRPALESNRLQMQYDTYKENFVYINLNNHFG